MKKTLLALATLAVAGTASAQSSVTLFGILDTSISHVTNKSDLTVANSLLPANALLPSSLKTSKTGLNTGAYNTSRIGFRGVEDLGGGLAASFWLESTVNTDDGTQGIASFDRRSTVSLSGNFGEVRLGRDYKPTFWNILTGDPFGVVGTGQSLAMRSGGLLESSFVRASNSVGYFLPKNLGGFYGQVQYAFNALGNEQTKYDNALQGSLNNNSRGGRYWGGRFGYANGPLDVAVAYGEQNNTSDWLVGSDVLAKNFNIAGTYDFGVVKLFGLYSQVKRDTDFSQGTNAFNPSSKLTSYVAGVTAPVGAGLIRASYSRSSVKTDVNPATPFATSLTPKADQFAVGYIHNLSKRTALYASVAYIKNKDGASYSAGSGNITAPFANSFTAPNGAVGVYTPKTSMGYDLGIRHMF